ncbi:MAG: HNH endonuclease [Candidatus Gracilibacteria bacterium]|nr:HNH endonuclease [Candidatus Gracilibacteria bacterium]
MPDRDVKTIKDQIFFQYAKIIAKASLGYTDGTEAKKKAYGFIKNKFRELQNGTISWSDITREDWQFVGSPQECIYCGSHTDLEKEHIVPKSLHINDRCKTCPTIQGISNQLRACKKCNTSKSDSGLYAYYKKILPDEKKYFDKLPSLLEKKYLKTIYNCHICKGTLDLEKEDINTLDLDL